STGREVYHIQRVRDADDPDPTDIIAWGYVEDKPKFQEGDWVRVSPRNPVVPDPYRGAVGLVEGVHEDLYYTVRFRDGRVFIASEKFLTPANPKDVNWEVGDIVPANTALDRNWL